MRYHIYLTLLNGLCPVFLGSVMCGLLSAPSVLQCSEADWDVGGRVASSSRICGAGVQYSRQLKRFTFNFGGQNFTISMNLCKHTHSRFRNSSFIVHNRV